MRSQEASPQIFTPTMNSQGSLSGRVRHTSSLRLCFLSSKSLYVPLTDSYPERWGVSRKVQAYNFALYVLLGSLVAAKERLTDSRDRSSLRRQV